MFIPPCLAPIAKRHFVSLVKWNIFHWCSTCPVCLCHTHASVLYAHWVLTFFGQCFDCSLACSFVGHADRHLVYKVAAGAEHGNDQDPFVYHAASNMLAGTFHSVTPSLTVTYLMATLVTVPFTVTPRLVL